MKLLEKANNMITAAGSDNTTSDELVSTIRQRITAAKSLFLTASVSVHVTGATEGERAFVSNLISEFNSRGFSITTEHPQFDVRADISVKRTGYVMNNHVTYAAGSVTVLRRTDGKRIVEIPVGVKGFHKDVNQSAINALSEAGAEAGGKAAESTASQLNNN